MIHLTPDSLLQIKAASVFLPIMLTIVSYSLYWSIASSKRLKERLTVALDSERASILHAVFKRIAGFILLGVLPLSVCILLINGYTPADAGLYINPGKMGFTVVSILLLSAITIPILSFSARKPGVLETYPEIRVMRWTPGIFLIEAATWAIYLLGYETLFRGMLLFGLAESLGPVPAIIVNVIFYSAAHIPKGKSETLAAIPFGIILCILTLHSGTIWIAFFSHLINAIVTSITARKFSPGVSFTWKNRGRPL